MEELRVVDLEQHAGDLSRQAQVHVLDEGEETLTCAGQKTHKVNVSTTAEGAGAFDERQVGCMMGKKNTHPASASARVEEQQPT